MIPENLSLGQIQGWIGQNLSRPECVVAHQSELLIVPNWVGNGGISIISPSSGGETHHILATSAEPVRPNGIALENGGTVLLAHMGESSGGIYRLHPDGLIETVVTRVNGKPIPPTNFIVLDSTGRLWITVSTRKIPRADDYRADAHSGFIAVAEPGESDARVVADNLGYTNECVIDEANGCVWVNETFGRRLTRFTIQLDPAGLVQLVDKHTVHEFQAGTYPDGLALDEDGFLWVTSIISNRILRVSPKGQCTIVFEDSDEAHLDWTESAFQGGSLGREHLDKAYGDAMQNLSNLAFGGADRCRIYLGNLLGSSIPFFDTQTRGVEMPHWNADLGALKRFVL